MAIFPNYPNINNHTSLYEVNLKSGNHITEKVGTLPKNRLFVALKKAAFFTKVTKKMNLWHFFRCVCKYNHFSI